MEQKQLTARQFRERILLLRAPLVMVPLVTLFFYALGGGKKDYSSAAKPPARGLNTTVPGPRIPKNDPMNKFGLYEQAARDSALVKERLKMQEQYAEQLGIALPADSAGAKARVSVNPDSLVRKAKEKLAALQEAIRSPERKAIPVIPTIAEPSKGKTDIEKLERIMGLIKNKNAEPDPEVEQLDGMLDKLVALQSPRKDSVGLRAKTRVEREALSIRVLAEDGDTSAGREIEAMVTEEQRLVGGAQIRLELVSSLSIGGKTVAAGTPLYGVTSLAGERLRVSISSIQSGDRVLPVRLEVYDEDGLPGIYIPGVPSADVLRESANQDAGGFEPGILSATIAGQATGAGIQLARNMIGKKLRVTRMIVPAGYHLLLKRIEKD
jgi:hypothetical protein